MNVSAQLTLTDMYMSILSSLSVNEKQDLIDKLKASLSTITPKKKPLTAAALFSKTSKDWGEGMSSEAYSDMLRESRTFTRTVETW